MYAPCTLPALLRHALTSDLYEESAEDFLAAHRIPYFTHNRQSLLTLAWNNGWRPDQ